MAQQIIPSPTQDNVRAIRQANGHYDIEVQNPEGVWISLNHFTSDPMWWLNADNQRSVMGWSLDEWFTRG